MNKLIIIGVIVTILIVGVVLKIKLTNKVEKIEIIEDSLKTETYAMGTDGSNKDNEIPYPPEILENELPTKEDSQ